MRFETTKYYSNFGSDYKNDEVVFVTRKGDVVVLEDGSEIDVEKIYRMYKFKRGSFWTEYVTNLLGVSEEMAFCIECFRDEAGSRNVLMVNVRERISNDDIRLQYFVKSFERLADRDEYLLKLKGTAVLAPIELLVKIEWEEAV